ncbi:hypothetical protein MMC14_003324 [Varicellaria rhodocarpa]|nr:hypothetical protein [Varicellaria rhodocarpa]
MDMADDSSSDEGGVPLSSQTIRALLYSQKPADTSSNITTTFTVKPETDNRSDPELSNHVSSEGVWALTKRHPNLTLQNSSVQKLGIGCGVPGAPKGPKAKRSARPPPISPKMQGVPTGPKAMRMSLSGSDGSKLDRAHASEEAKKAAMEGKRKTRIERRQRKRESMTIGGEDQSRKGWHRVNNGGQDNSSANTQRNDKQTSGSGTALRQLRSRVIFTHFVREKATTEAPLGVIDHMDVVDGLSSLTLNPEVQLSNSETKAGSAVRPLSLENPNSRRRQRGGSGRGTGLPSKPQKSSKFDNRTKLGKSGKSYKIQKSPKLTKEDKSAPQYKELRLKLRKAKLSTSIKGFDDRISALKDNPSSAHDLDKQIKNLERKKQHAQIRLEKSEGILDGQEAQQLLRLTSKKGGRVRDTVVDDLTAGLEAAMNGVLGREISVA